MRCTAGYRGCRPGELSNQCQPDILLLPSLFSLLSPSLVFSLFTSPSLFSQSFFFIQLPLFLCLRFLPLTLFSLFLILALTSIPPFFRSLFQQEKGNVGGPSPTGNTLVIAFWSLWHDKVCQAKAAQLHAQKDTRARTQQRQEVRAWKAANTLKHEPRQKARTERLANKHCSSSRVQTAIAV